MKPTPEQKESLANIIPTKEQIAELEELCNLYIKSNPNFNKKDGQQEAKEQPKGASGESAEDILTMVTQV